MKKKLQTNSATNDGWWNLITVVCGGGQIVAEFVISLWWCGDMKERGGR